jgi:predicted acetyltransferase
MALAFYEFAEVVTETEPGGHDDIAVWDDSRVDVRISEGTELDELAVRNMFVAYLNELAAWDPGLVVNDVGLPVWKNFGLPGPRTGPEAARHNWWIRDDCERLVIREGDSAVGFAIIASPPHHIDEPFDHEVVDFYVVPKARRRGLGERTARRILAERPGSWVLFTLAGNVSARAFWRRVLAEPPVVGMEERNGASEFRFRVRQTFA